MLLSFWFCPDWCAHHDPGYACLPEISILKRISEKAELEMAVVFRWLSAKMEEDLIKIVFWSTISKVMNFSHCPLHVRPTGFCVPFQLAGRVFPLLVTNTRKNPNSHPFSRSHTGMETDFVPAGFQEEGQVLGAVGGTYAFFRLFDGAKNRKIS